jgi:hypothetical protein
MLDLSAAFDVIDHAIFRKKLEYSFGISGGALQWLLSYLQDRTHRIAIGIPPRKSYSRHFEIVIALKKFIISSSKWMEIPPYKYKFQENLVH